MTNQKSSGPPATFGSHKQFVKIFDEYLGAVYPPSGGNRKDTGRREFALRLAAVLRERAARDVLDCGAGTGFPSLDLMVETKGEFEIHCCDGDGTMTDMLATKANKEDVDLQLLVPPRSKSKPLAGQVSSLVVNWADLDELASLYDYVLCRGNALAYADSWTGTENVASEKTIHDYVEQMIRRIRPGGYFHVDAPKTTGLDRTISRILGALSIEEEVKVDADRRRWTVTFRRGDENPVSFVRYSSILTIGRLQAILNDLGLEETEPIDLAEERPNFGVIIARKPA